MIVTTESCPRIVRELAIEPLLKSWLLTDKRSARLVKGEIVGGARNMRVRWETVISLPEHLL